MPDLVVEAVDLHAGLDVEHASMADYAAAVTAAALRLPAPVALLGWSMGGLVVLMAAGRLRAAAVVLLEPSPPAEIQGIHAEIESRAGLFDAEAVYGRFPPGVRARPESVPARAQRKRGISVPQLPCPALVCYGDEFPEDRGRAIVRLYGAAELPFPGLGHWGLVHDPRVRAAAARFLATVG